MPLIKKLISACTRNIRSFTTNSITISNKAQLNELRPLPNLILCEDPRGPTPFRFYNDKLSKNEDGNIIVPVKSFIGDEEMDKIALSSYVFGQPLRRDILQRVVKYQLAAKRQGTHKTKTRSEVSGSGKKPWKQKGTGRARFKDRKGPQWRGGYVAHGPKVRDHSIKLQRKVSAMGLRVALSARLNEGRLLVVDKLFVDTHKTKYMKSLLEKKGWDNLLFVFTETDVNRNFELGIRNLPNIECLQSEDTNVYSILRKKNLILTPTAIKNLEQSLTVYL